MAAPQDLSIRQLQYVVAVADTLGFRRAAERCHVSQPTLSAQIKEIEGLLDVRIFDRDRRKVVLTRAGEAIVARARKVLASVEELLAESRRVRDPFSGTLRIGVIPTVAPYLLPDVTPALSARYPALKLAFLEEKTADVVRDLEDARIDAGLLALEADVGDVDAAPITKDPFVVALPKGHPLEKKPRLSVSDLDPLPLLLLDDGHCFRDQALAACSKSSAKEVDFRATSLATLAQMVSSGAGVTLLPRLAVDVENRRGQLSIRPIAPPVPSRTIALVWRKGAALAKPLEAIAQTMRAALRGQSS